MRFVLKSALFRSSIMFLESILRFKTRPTYVKPFHSANFHGFRKAFHALYVCKVTKNEEQHFNNERMVLEKYIFPQKRLTKVLTFNSKFEKFLSLSVSLLSNKNRVKQFLYH